ncbi:hypothetical protein [Rhizobium sp. Leaf383]|uniref:hypothetical protein n=1 Tax=Rhizobium sp. Leaf383 TaxID=1736357 RepID=UPI0007143667|nr:hypothetical protein [Rhizobium sp. Leaf383]KQS84274.1 hypothetical protein ASG58_21120 [Rhizobium sp. Leaf383]
MILETTNPKYLTRPQIPAGRKFAFQTHDRADLEYISDGTRSMARGELQTENFVDRKPHEAPIPNREPQPKPRGSSLTLFDEAHDAPLWLIIDLTTGVVFARVRGSLPWVVDQVRLAASQLGGKESDLYYKRAN